jgi:hypothetical protein
MSGRYRGDSDPGLEPEPEQAGPAVAGRLPSVRDAIYGWLERTSFSRATAVLAGGAAMLAILGFLLAGWGAFGRGGSSSPEPSRLAMKAPAAAAAAETPPVRPVRTPVRTVRASPRPAAGPNRVSPAPRRTGRPVVRPGAGQHQWPRHLHDRWPLWWWLHHHGGHR